jgi:hypothetical protein
MTNVMARLFLDVQPSKAKQSLYLDGNCFLVAPTINEHSLGPMLISAIADGSTCWQRKALYGCRSSRLDIAFHRIWAETNPNKM